MNKKKVGFGGKPFYMKAMIGQTDFEKNFEKGLRFVSAKILSKLYLETYSISISVIFDKALILQGSKLKIVINLATLTTNFASA